MATAVSVMQGHVTKTCEQLRNIIDSDYDVMDLTAILVKLRPDTAPATMAYIRLQDDPFKNEADIMLQTPYENKILGLLTAIRNSYFKESMATERIRITGQVTLARVWPAAVPGHVAFQ